MIASFGEILFDVYPERELLGGAPFNFLFHIHRLTGSGTMISRVGNDDRGAAVRDFLSRHAMDQHFVQIDARHPTGAAFVSLDTSGIPTFTIAEDSAYDFIELNSETESLTDSCAMLYFGTLVQRSEVSRMTLYELAQRPERCFLDVNLRQQYYSDEVLRRSLVLADIVKLNKDELEVLHPLLFSSPFSLSASARRLMETYSLSHLAVTLGEEGSWLFTQEGEHFHRSIAASVRDTVGAGDAFAAMMCLGIVRGWNLERIHTLASEFSADLCGIDGALPKNNFFYERYRKEV